MPVRTCPDARNHARRKSAVTAAAQRALGIAAAAGAAVSSSIMTFRSLFSSPLGNLGKIGSFGIDIDIVSIVNIGMERQ